MMGNPMGEPRIHIFNPECSRHNELIGSAGLTWNGVDSTWNGSTCTTTLTVSSPEVLANKVSDLEQELSEIKQSMSELQSSQTELKELIKRSLRPARAPLKTKTNDEIVSHGRTVWTKSTRQGPYITIRPVAVNLPASTRVVSGWIVRDRQGDYHELPEEDLTEYPSALSSNPAINGGDRYQAMSAPTLIFTALVSYSLMVLFILGLAYIKGL